jgi:acyl-coenzyme A thioesterase PaaI-like protein
LKLYLPSYDTCFACGKKNPEGLRLCLYVDNGRVVSEFAPREEHCGFSGILHGGIISCIVDEALWWSSAVASGRLVVTKDLRVDYLRSLTVRKIYTVEADPPEPQGRVYVCRGRIVDRTRALCVRGEGTYFPLRGGKNRNPQHMLSYVDKNGNPLPEDRVYRFGTSEPKDIPGQSVE